MHQEESQQVFLRRCVSEALLMLMETMSFDHIKVTDICKRAGVSRMTYYRNFSGKKSVLSYYLDCLFEVYVNRMTKLCGDSPNALGEGFFHFWGVENVQFTRCLLKANMSNLLLDKFSVYLDEMVNKYSFFEVSSVEPFACAFFAGGLYKVLADWVLAENGISSKEMALRLNEYTILAASLWGKN